MKNWMRVLKVTLKQDLGNGKGRAISFGDNEYPNENLSMSIRINKYMSVMKDSALIAITNLTYQEVLKIMTGKFYSVEITCGYKSSNQFIVFKGSILRIQNTMGMSRNNTINILCGSDLIAKFSQRTLNFNLSSSINVYSAINYMSRLSGIGKTNASVSTQFKKEFLQQNISSNDNIGSFLNNLCNNNETYIINADNSNGAVFSIFDARRSNSRVIKIKNEDFIGGFPSLSSEGLEFSVIPSFNFQCGDVVLIDNASINLSGTSSISGLSTQPGMFLDKNGAYMILSMTYNLTNREDSFSCEIKAKARSLISNYIGVN